MGKMDYYKIGFLLLIPLLIFFPLFNTTYFYTDEITQLWFYGKDPSFAMFVPQGRFLNHILFRTLYGAIDTIAQLQRLRLFALAGWLLSIPAWYKILSRVSRDEGLPPQLPFLAVLYLTTSLPFSISIQWAACMELFIANTCGLLAGYFVYRYERWGWIPAFLLGLVSLFFYQNGFGCYLLPFFLQFVVRQTVSRKLLRPLLIYFSVYLVYFLLFKTGLHALYHVDAVERTALAGNPLNKLLYLLGKVLPGAFYFNVVVQESAIAGRIVYLLIAGGCLFASCWWLSRSTGKDIGQLFRYALTLLAAFIGIYLPSMIVRENYASNRTLLALDMAVFLWVFVSLLRIIPKENWRTTLFVLAGLGFAGIGWNNFRNIFLRPATDEYVALRTFMDNNYNSNIVTIDYIRSSEDQVRKFYHLSSSWDEYGFSSSYFAWVPESVTRQLVYERTGSRAVAEKLQIRVWASRQAWQTFGLQETKGELLIDAPALLSGSIPGTEGINVAAEK